MLIDRHLPVFDVVEYHELAVAVPAGRAYDAVRSVDLARSAAVRTLLALRGLPGLAGGSPTARSFSIADFVRHGFVLLGEEPGAEIVLGVVGRFWTPRGGVVPVRLEEFASFDEPGYAKAAWNFSVRPLSGASSVVATETRVRCTDIAARRKFLRYWRVVGPASGFIRRRALALVKRDAEAATPA